MTGYKQARKSVRTAHILCYVPYSCGASPDPKGQRAQILALRCAGIRACAPGAPLAALLHLLLCFLRDIRKVSYDVDRDFLVLWRQRLEGSQ